MLQFLTALAEVLPAAGKFVDAIAHHEEKASTAASVAKDPNAPADVRQAATNVAATSIDAKAAAEKEALKAVTGKAPDRTDNTGIIVLGVGLLLLMASKRR